MDQQPFVATLSAADTYRLGDPIIVTFEITNTSAEPVRFLVWGTPFEPQASDFLLVTHDGEPVEYDGQFVKRGNPSPSNYIVLTPGERRSADVEISALYAIDVTGSYEAELRVDLYDALPVVAEVVSTPRLRGDLEPHPLARTSIRFEVVAGDAPRATLGQIARTAAQAITGTAPHTALAKALAPSFNGGTTSQQAATVQAHDTAQQYTAASARELQIHAADALYTEWFGAMDVGRYSTVQKHYQDISGLLAGSPITYDLTGTGCGADWYAYTHKGDRTVWLCGLYLSAPATGTDSKFGTLVHEWSHAVSSTDDVVYGQTACRTLATTDPTKAITNADSHEYFAEHLTIGTQFGDLLDGRHPVWVGDFNGNGRTDVMFHYAGDSNWWWGQLDAADKLQWTLVGNTAGFGSLLDGKHPVWVGDFNGNGRTDLLFYYSGDSNWWWGQLDAANKLQWTLVGNTAGFGSLLDGKHPVWVGDFNGNGRTDLMFYYSGDSNWWWGQLDANNKLQWSNVGNTKGFGNLLDGKHPVWVGDFNGNGRTDLMFYYSGDSNWWWAQLDANNTLQWSNVGNTAGFGSLLDGKHPVWVGDFNGNGRTDLMFYYSGDSNWWWAQLDANNTLQWSNVGNTAGFGNLLDGKHPVWIGDFNGNGRTDLMFYYSGDSNWWWAQLDAKHKLQWSKVGNTKGFGSLLDGRHPVWVGDFNGNGRTDVMFYYGGDANWWWAQLDGANTLQWSLVGNTG